MWLSLAVRCVPTSAAAVFHGESANIALTVEPDTSDELQLSISSNGAQTSIRNLTVNSGWLGIDQAGAGPVVWYHDCGPLR